VRDIPGCEGRRLAALYGRRTPQLLGMGQASDVAVAGGQRFAHRGIGLVGRGAEHAEADARHRCALVQRQRCGERRGRRWRARHATFRVG
jgi:hypothetical protein